jgi:AAA domain, putative AbiEii toxin, Type IV TA system
MCLPPSIAICRRSIQTLPIPSGICRRLAAELHLDRHTFNKVLLSKLEEVLGQNVGQYQVLYLPTYRRIEKELASIFPDLEESIQTFQRKRGVLAGDHRRKVFNESRRGFVELVEFGMEDVEATFFHARRDLIETAKSELSNLAGGYLRDVIRGDGEEYEAATFNQLDDATIDRILNRAEEQTLSDGDKSRLKAVIEKLKITPRGQVQPGDRYIAHFFSKLINVDRALSEKEVLIQRFTQVCNGYLSGKQLVYNDKESSISVRLQPSGELMELKALSSGEKQIVSLFSYLYLKERGDVLVIIDEPELSLSVTWQQRFLPDILETGRCKFLAAVTHSPFIFQNHLDSVAVDLAGCITEGVE